MSLMNPGDQFISINLSSGGHLTHGMKLNTSAIFYKPAHYELDPKTFHVVHQISAERARWVPSLNTWSFRNGMSHDSHHEADDYKNSERAGIRYHLVKPAYQRQLHELLERLHSEPA